MSGKAPPRAPRALLNSFPSSAAPSSSATTSSGTSRIGATPPTGPRSLLSGATGHGGRGVGRGKPYVNGHGAIPAGPAAVSPPTGPRSLSKGKQVETQLASTSSAPEPPASSLQTTPGTQRGLPYAQVNGAGPSKLNGEAVGLTNNRSQPVSFRLRRPPPQPTTEPPPPPPPTIAPPPPPPPSSPPPPPPPPPGADPPPPPPSEPPPPPSSDPPPPPPSSEPPPPPSSEPPPPPSSEPPPPPPPLSPSPSRPPSPPPLQSASEPPPPPSTIPPRLPPTAPRSHAASSLVDLSRSLPTGPRVHTIISIHAPPPQSPPPPPPPAEPKLYSLPPPPPWPPAHSEYPPGRNYKVLYDHVADKDRDGQIRLLADKLRELGKDVGEDARVKGKGKGREIVIRYEGETIEGEHPAVLRDPRKELKVKRKETLRPVRLELVPVRYEHDANSNGPPLPTAVLVLSLSPLTPNSHIRRCFSIHGTITSFEPQIDKTTGAALGIVFIKYSTHEEARKCVEKEHGKKLTALNGIAGGGEEMTVVLDGEGRKLRAIMKQLDTRRRRAQDEKRRKERENKEKGKEASSAHSARGTPTTAAHTPVGSTHSSRPPVPWQKSSSMRPPPASAKLPPKPITTPMDMPDSKPSHLNGVPSGPRGAAPARVRKAVPSTFRARLSSVSKYSSSEQSLRPPLPTSESTSSTPIRSWERRGRDYIRDWYSRSPSRSRSRSPSPVMRRPGQSSRNAYQKDHDAVLEELAKNGYEHVTLDGHGGHLGSVVREEDVRRFFQGFQVDKILRDRLGWYVTFETSDTARRAAMVLNHGSRTLASRTVNVTVHPAPSPPSAPSQKRWTDVELVNQATSLVTKELRSLLEKDLLDKVVSTSVQRLILAEKEHRTTRLPDGDNDARQWNAGLRGLSFKKQRKRPREEDLKRLVTESTPEPLDARPEQPVQETLPERPKKRQKKASRTKIIDEDIESEDEAHETLPMAVTKAAVNEDVESEDEDVSLPVIRVLDDVARKRSTSEATDVEGPVKKRFRTQESDDSLSVVTPASLPKKAKKVTTKKTTKTQPLAIVTEVVHQVLPDDFDFDVPKVAQVRVTATPRDESSVSPPLSPVWEKRTLPSRRVEIPDPFLEGLCEDDEDLYFAKLALARDYGIDESELEPSFIPDPDAPPPFRVHVTGSARTEGYYKISHAEKSAYVAQYASRVTVNEVAPEKEQAPQQNVTSSRSNRANARRRAQGLEEINQVQRAMALSKGESAATELIKFNQLQTRKKHLRFARSPIHDWGLYAMERIMRGEMVIEYVGEIIRAQVADKREKAYERQGIGSSYLFRIDEDLVVDATKKGNLGRLINHSCEPNCTARIITINGEKKIVIYAKQDIELGSEITYDYHFPIEQDKIPCLCGSAKCRGFLN